MSPLDVGRAEEPRSGPDAALEAAAAADAEASLWTDFATAATVDAFARAWLALQCRRIGGVWGAVLLLGAADRGPFSPVAVWPDRRRAMTHVTVVAERALIERRGLVVKRDADGDPGGQGRERIEIAYPIEVDGHLHGVIALDAAPRAERELQGVLRQLQWGAGWLEVLVRREAAAHGAATRERLQAVLDLLASAVGQPRFYAAATAFVTSVATRLGCDRASLGFVRRGRVRVRAMSHSAHFRKETNLVRAIESAMDEAYDQHAVVAHPPLPERPPAVARAHAELARHAGSASACSVPLVEGTLVVGVLTLERSADRPFDVPAVELAEAVAAVAGPLLEVRRREDRWLLTKIAEVLGTQVGRLVGPRYVVRKLVAVALVGLVGFFAIAEGDYRVTARSMVEAAVQRAAVAPFDGYIARAEVRAGDLVKMGQLLATLDDRELKLERERWVSQREQVTKQLNRALAERNAAEVRILRAQIDQAEAQVALQDEQIGRMVIQAPFDGVVVSGDLSQRLGAPVRRGDVLFEVAPLGAYRLVLQVDERDVGDVRVSRRGQVVLPALPTEPVPFVVEKLTPVSATAEGRNYFRVEARLESMPERLRPGMEGVAKVEVDRRLLAWIWTREVIDWVRLQLWTWLP